MFTVLSYLYSAFVVFCVSFLLIGHSSAVREPGLGGKGRSRSGHNRHRIQPSTQVCYCTRFIDVIFVFVNASNVP